ncbi:Fic family protein [Spirulina sp. CCNP1310]|uniref:Fic family protein n=1 Tax=Spirulina sp. CCNP1310 TaxID=3110249 RepID=UPI002B206737|nr:Fic family protein [Spirulina sp. CCNP1310]MEA5419133.1 Fic family protein [Spirulina sp. CCNP1310]
MRLKPPLLFIPGLKPHCSQAIGIFRKPVLGEPKEIQEVQGAILAYEALKDWDATRKKDLLAAHQILMGEILTEAGKFRRGGVGIYRGTTVTHVAPPAKRVPFLMDDLLEWLATTEHHPLISSSIFHYELEFIHPFSDGNGRMGRLWQTVILGKWNDLFYLLPMESLIKAQADQYYQALEQADRAADSTVFIEFMLEVIMATLKQYVQTSDQVSDQATDQVSDQVQQLLAIMGDRTAHPEPYWTTRELMAQLDLTHQPTFRKNYLKPAIAAGLVRMRYPNQPRHPQQQYRKI